MKNKKRLLFILLSVLFLFTPLFIQWVIWADKALVCTEITVSSKSLPENFDGFRIAHISDLHNTEFGDGNQELLKMISDAKPDIIAITGDLIDSRETDLDIALHFAQEAAKVAPCYYSVGNHEAVVEELPQLEEGLKAAGVTVLRNEAVTLDRNGQTIQVIGLDDYMFFDGELGSDCVNNMLIQLCWIQNQGFNILLAHRPEFFHRIAGLNVELILSGHAHGGQIRLPLVGGLYGPDQGLFPKYDAGLFQSGESNMVVSRGLGNSQFPFRVNNRPEVVIITLKKEKS